MCDQEVCLTEQKQISSTSYLPYPYVFFFFLYITWGKKGYKQIVRICSLFWGSSFLLNNTRKYGLGNHNNIFKLKPHWSNLLHIATKLSVPQHPQSSLSSPKNTGILSSLVCFFIGYIVPHCVQANSKVQQLTLAGLICQCHSFFKPRRCFISPSLHSEKGTQLCNLSCSYCAKRELFRRHLLHGWLYMCYHSTRLKLHVRGNELANRLCFYIKRIRHNGLACTAYKCLYWLNKRDLRIKGRRTLN